MDLAEANVIMILIPDGVGIRNFVYSDFYYLLTGKGYRVVYVLPEYLVYADFPFEFIVLKEPKVHWLTGIFNAALIRAELLNNTKRFDDPVYLTYIFKRKIAGFKSRVKYALELLIARMAFHMNGISYLHRLIEWFESGTQYYKHCYSLFSSNRPSFLLISNQRHSSCVAPVQAAKNLRIKTGSFIFSWDNLPKGTKVVRPEYYFVWSAFMKNELQRYYPDIRATQIAVFGTPQFEIYYKKAYILEKEVFFKMFDLDITKTYICFSGDDITTSPYDEEYLRDLAEAVRYLNSAGHSLGILFRKSPVEVTNRYQSTILAYKDIIRVADPEWYRIGDSWNTIVPGPRDNMILASTVYYCACVVNIGSSMVFDFACLGKPCIYIKYNTDVTSEWRVEDIYHFVHFRSMPSSRVVLWVNAPEEFSAVIQSALGGVKETVESAREWMEVICQHPVQHSSQRLVDSIERVISNK